METTNTKFETFLPVFPGFYNTIFESDGAEDSEISYINDERADKGLEPISWDECDFDYKEYHDRVSNKCVEVIESELKALSLINEITFQSLVSPTYYNYSTDSINVEIDVNIENLQKYISENKKQFIDYLKVHYTSCSGFIASYSNDFDVWAEDTESFTNFDVNGHYLGALLQFVCDNEGIDTEKLCGGCDSEIYTINIINYNELIGE